MKSYSTITTLALLLAVPLPSCHGQLQSSTPLNIPPLRQPQQQQQQQPRRLLRSRSVISASIKINMPFPEGTPCNVDTTCNQCENGVSSFWSLAGQQRCGTEPAPGLVDNTPCIPYSSCQQCASGFYGAGHDNIFRCGVINIDIPELEEEEESSLYWSQ